MADKILAQEVVAGILLPALLAGFVVAGGTMLIERKGGIIGGVVSSMPSTIVISSLALVIDKALADEPIQQFADNILSSVPPAVLLATLVLGVWRVFTPRLEMSNEYEKLAAVFGMSLMVWLVCAGILVSILPGLRSLSTPPLTIAVVSLVIAGILSVISALVYPVEAAPASMPTDMYKIFFRGLVGFVFVALSISAGRLNALAGALFTTFPSTAFIALVSLWISHPESVVLGVVGPMMLGNLSIGMYCIIFGGTASRFGIAGAVVFAWISAIVMVSLPVFFAIRHVVHKKSLLTILTSPEKVKPTESRARFVKFEDVDGYVPPDAVDRWT